MKNKKVLASIFIIMLAFIFNDSRAFYRDDYNKIPKHFHSKYDDTLGKEKAYYIVTLCRDFNLDCNLAIAILLNENPELNTKIVSKKNKNGSRDLGMWQLNSNYLPFFVELYWDSDKIFDVSDWRDNTYIAIRLIKDLNEVFLENPELTFCAYNCGLGAVMKNKIPESTEKYKQKALKNYYVIASL